MKIAKFPPLLAAIAGFLAGCVVMYFILSRTSAPAKISAPTASAPLAETKQVQTNNKEKSQEIDVEQVQAALRDAETAWFSMHFRLPNVGVRFFEMNDGKISLSLQFADFFKLSSAETAKLSDLVQTSRAELWDTQKAQAQVTQTATGEIVIKIPPLDAGPDIYDKVMDGFLSVLGSDRYQDMMYYNNYRQFEQLFDEFGGEERMFTFEKIDHDHYNFSENHIGILGVGSERSMSSATLEEIRKFISNPRMLELISTPEK